jgi:hypothetical protein
MDYVILAQMPGGGRLLLAEDETALARARVYVRATRELTVVDKLGNFYAHGPWEDYEGAQDALAGLVPERIFEEAS